MEVFFVMLRPMSGTEAPSPARKHYYGTGVALFGPLYRYINVNHKHIGQRRFPTPTDFRGVCENSKNLLPTIVGVYLVGPHRLAGMGAGCSPSYHSSCSPLLLLGLSKQESSLYTDTAQTTG